MKGTRQIIINVPVDAEIDEEAVQRNVYAQIDAAERIRVLMEIRDMPLAELKELKELKAKVQLEKLEKEKAKPEKIETQPSIKEVVAEVPVAEEKAAEVVAAETFPEVLIEEEKIGDSEVDIVLE